MNNCYKCLLLYKGGIMKYFVLVSMIAVSSCVYALCPIGDNSVCTLPDVGTGNDRLLQNPGSGLKNNNSSNSLQPFTTVSPFEYNIDSSRELNYDSGCQFGKCPDKVKNKILPNQN